MSKLHKSFKGQISKETEKAIEIIVMDDAGVFFTWIPKSALDMKQMSVNCISEPAPQIFHIHQWFLDLKAKEKKTETEFIKEAEKQPEVYETRTLSKDTVAVDMPKPPTPDRIEFPFFPNMSVLELRDYHLKENTGNIRGHIENITMDKRLLDVVIDLLGKQTDTITAIIELKDMLKEAIKK